MAKKRKKRKGSANYFVLSLEPEYTYKKLDGFIYEAPASIFMPQYTIHKPVSYQGFVTLHDAIDFYRSHTPRTRTTVTLKNLNNPAIEDKDIPIPRTSAASVPAVPVDFDWTAHIEEAAFLKALEDYRPHPTTKPSNKYPTLAYLAAARNFDWRIFEALMRLGHDLSAARTKDQPTPLHIACRRGHARAIRGLLKQNADINKRAYFDERRIKGKTPFRCLVDYAQRTQKKPAAARAKARAKAYACMEHFKVIDWEWVTITLDRTGDKLSISKIDCPRKSKPDYPITTLQALYLAQPELFKRTSPDDDFEDPETYRVLEGYHIRHNISHSDHKRAFQKEFAGKTVEELYEALEIPLPHRNLHTLAQTISNRFVAECYRPTNLYVGEGKDNTAKGRLAAILGNEKPSKPGSTPQTLDAELAEHIRSAGIPALTEEGDGLIIDDTTRPQLEDLAQFDPTGSDDISERIESAARIVNAGLFGDYMRLHTPPRVSRSARLFPTLDNIAGAGGAGGAGAGAASSAGAGAPAWALAGASRRETPAAAAKKPADKRKLATAFGDTTLASDAARRKTDTMSAAATP